MTTVSELRPNGLRRAKLFGADKIQAQHYPRSALVYVRQSTPQQVLNHRESTELQYKLVERAAALGWPMEQIQVIDDDLGLSARTAENRAGFQRLLAEVATDHVGLVLGIEMSRLARSCKDWYHLLEICALFGTLLADQDGLYDPSNYNDRLLLGLKGTMSEAELHVLQGRMHQGRLNKAARGALFSHPPIGYVRDPYQGLIFDPDEQVRLVIGLVFDKFTELGRSTPSRVTCAAMTFALGSGRTTATNAGSFSGGRPAVGRFARSYGIPCTLARMSMAAFRSIRRRS